MDTAFIDQYEQTISSYRLRTARQKKRLQYEDFDKQLIQLKKRERELYRQVQQLGWQPLEPPVQKGWIRHFVLRPDIATGRHAAFFDGILNKINTYQFDWRKEFVKKKRKRGKKILVPVTQNLLAPDDWHFKKMAFTEMEQQFFYDVWEENSRGELFRKHVFREPWRFVLKVSSNMIDKVRIRDGALESELQLIENYIDKNGYRHRQNKIFNGYAQRKWYRGQPLKHTEYDIYKAKSLDQMLDMIRHS